MKTWMVAVVEALDGTEGQWNAGSLERGGKEKKKRKKKSASDCLNSKVFQQFYRRAAFFIFHSSCVHI